VRRSATHRARAVNSLRRRALPRPLSALVLMATVHGLVESLVRPAVALRVDGLGAGPGVLGQIVGAEALGGLVAAVPIGRLVDRIGPRLPLRVSLVGMALAGVLLALGEPLLVIGLGQILFGSASVGAWLSLQAMAVGARDPIEARRLVAAVSTAVLVGASVGPVLGGIITEQRDAGSALLVGAVLLAMGAAVRGLARPASSDRTERGVPPSARELLGERHVRTAVTVSASVSALQVLRSSFLPVLLVSAGWNPGAIGLVLGLAGAGGLLARVTFALLERRLGAWILMPLALVPGAVALAVATFAPNPVVVGVSMAVSGFSFALAQPATLLISTDGTRSSALGGAVGVRLAANRAAQMTAPVVVGFLIRGIGIAGGLWTMTLAIAVVGLRPLATRGGGGRDDTRAWGSGPRTPEA
jgi:predicted MFS family arabinose efflux permease